MRQARLHAGSALLEVLAALAIVGIAGSAVALQVSVLVRNWRSASQVELDLQRADRVMSALTLLRSSELRDRVGTRGIGEFVAVVSEEVHGVFSIKLTSRANPGSTLLATLVAPVP